MNRKAGIVVVIVVIIAAIVVTLVLNSSHTGENSRTNTTGNSMGNMGMNGSGSGKAVATDTVTIANFAFSPADITVKKGTTVTWTNKDSAAHTVTETDGKAGPASSDLPQGKSYSFTYDTVGTFAYHCSIHPDMIGTVTVTD